MRNKYILFLITIITGYFTPVLALAHGDEAGHGMMSLGDSVGNFHWFGGITMILVWILLILGIAALVKWLQKK